MEVKKKISLMLVVVLLVQILLPMLTVVLESDLTLFSRAEEEPNTWDISATNQDHVTATFDEETGLLTISGTGNIKEWASSAWGSVRKQIKKVTIGEGVTSIGRYAFSGCTSLTSVEIPEGVTSIGNYAFSDCTSLTSINVDENNEKYESIDGVLFNKNASEIIKYPAGKKEADYTIPEGVTSIGDYAFSGCTSLTSINVDENNQTYKSIDGVLFNKDGTRLIKYPEGRTNSNYIIPEGVTSIGDKAFYRCASLEQIEIPEGITSIGMAAFYNCTSLKQIEIPEGVTSIGSSTFYDCTSLSNITIHEGVTDIGNWAFDGCTSLEQIEIPEGLTSIGVNAFYGCTSLKQIEIPESVINFGDNVFSNSKLLLLNINEAPEIIKRVFNENNELYYTTDIEFKNCSYNGTNIIINEDVPYGTLKINGGVLRGLTVSISKTRWDISATENDHVTATLDEETGLLTITGTGNMKNWTSSSNVPWTKVTEKIKNVTIEEGVTTIGGFAFSGCTSLEQIEIPESVTSIGKWAFSDCTSLSNITIPEGVTSIGSSAFKKCTSLEQIEIPEGVTNIESSAFSDCTSLTNINVDENNEKYKSIDGVLFNKAETDLIKYPAGKANSKYTIPKGVTSIGNYAFEECTSLEQIEIPESVTSIGWYVFYNCTGLEQIEIPESVTSIGDNAFRGCTSLEQIEIPDGVTSIGGSAFSGCTSLEQIEIPESVTSIGDYAFSGCTSLKQIEIPDGVTSIGYSAFYGCTSLEQIEIPDGVTSIGYKAFYGCTSLEQIEIPEGVTSIRSEAFYNCKSLKKIKIPEGVTSIENHAFYNCISLEQIEIPESVTSIGEDSFCRCTSLKNINVNENNQNYKSIDGVLFNKDITTIIQYPAGRTDSNYIIPEGVTSIGGHAFYYCTSLKQVEIPEGVTSIGMAAFLGCTSLEQIKIPEGVTNIGKSAFLGCTIITSIEIPEGVTSIESLAFYECTSLTRIVIPEGVTSIGDRAFEYCQNLTKIKISNKISSIGQNAFRNTKLSYIEIPQGKTVGNIDMGIYKENEKDLNENIKVATGMNIKISDILCKVVVKGDLNGDGQVGDIDLLRLARYKVGLDTTLMDEYLQAADINGNGNVADDIDLLMMARTLVGLYSL